ncbi:hypothetical protein [Thalassotalea piscium]|uniref:Uncharacterized protein n=1 Tax=Thalassotalea piscium TaxID=1230533 RepID=A0A7X0TV00_9GAMM|nr:hypothetical protein [Thalassotalea piscium]MBB6544922.1 hypothetical protein [Thalassotalea piscium]
MEVFIVIATLVIVWFAWQLYRAKQFTRFKKMVNTELKSQVIADIKEELTLTRSEVFPNNNCHQQATIDYWCRYPVRILQAALIREVINEQWLRETGNYRNSQHLLHIQQDKAHRN